MAAPHVAGAVALMWSQRPTLSNVRIKALLLEGARSPIDPRLEDWDDTNANITAELFGSGRVSAEAAVIKALDEP